MKGKAIILGVLFLMLGSIAGAQSTPYSTSRFAATFNGPVSFITDQNDKKTSVNNEWSSSNNGVLQQLTIRDIAHDIDVNKTSLDYYVNQALDGSPAIDRKYGVYQGHPWEFAYYNQEGVTWRMWFIIVNPNTVIVLSQLTDIGRDDSTAWSTFANSLAIK
jgi:hypothetical protein